ncbi:Alpha/Beta hydrolase protein [Hyaloraphidium curvatum]|nr:Alpha/Beta hydrolase protein [Hyaloraphidium curvatum]
MAPRTSEVRCHQSRDGDGPPRFDFARGTERLRSSSGGRAGHPAFPPHLLLLRRPHLPPHPSPIPAMRVQVNGVRLFCDTVGGQLEPSGRTMRERPALVVLHGGPGLDHTALRPDMDALADVAQVIYVDHRGHGRSDRGDPSGWTLAQWADDVRGLCDALGLVRPVVMGHSFGGMVAQAYAARHPGHAGGVVFAGTSGRRSLQRMLAMFEKLGGKPVRDAAERFWTSPSPESAAEYVALAYSLYNPTSRDPDASARGIQNPDVLFQFAAGEMPAMDLLPGLANVRCPALVIGGELDPVCPIQDQEDILAALPKGLARLERFGGCGHSVWRDAPERFYGVMREFVRGVGEANAQAAGEAPRL